MYTYIYTTNLDKQKSKSLKLIPLTHLVHVMRAFSRHRTYMREGYCFSSVCLSMKGQGSLSHDALGQGPSFPQEGETNQEGQGALSSAPPDTSTPLPSS